MPDTPWSIDGDAVTALLSGARKSVYLLDLDSGAMRWSPNTVSALRAPHLESVKSGDALRNLFRDEDCVARDEWMRDPNAMGVFGGEYRMRGVGGAERWIEEQAVRLREENQIVGMLTDVHERREREDLTAYLASYDQLTGLMNRLQLREKLAQSVAEARTRNGETALLLVGVDNMSSINDAYGYDIADEVIVGVTARLRDVLGPSDHLGRVSGSKFGMVLDDCDAECAEAVAVRARESVRSSVVKTHAGPVAVTVSVGIAILPSHGMATHDAMSTAEEALNEARAISPDVSRLYVPNAEKRHIRREHITVAEQILTAYSEDRLLVAYQPVVRADDPSKVAFYECLARMRTPEGDLAAASSFMPVAEKLGLVRLLDQHVMEIAFNALRAVDTLRLSINISPQSAQDPVWLDSFLDLAQGNSDVIARLIVEITESTVIKDAKQTAKVVDKLRALGCAFALDDFGAGYTSFRHFKDLRMDMVKIDGAFVRGVAENRHNQLFVRALTDIARNFDMMTVAEMVASDADAAILREIGVDAFQGFMYGEPNVMPDWLPEPLARAARG